MLIPTFRNVIIQWMPVFIFFQNTFGVILWILVVRYVIVIMFIAELQINFVLSNNLWSK